MIFLNFSQCSNQQQFMKLLTGIEITLSKLRTIKKFQIDKFTKFFHSNICYIINDQAVASRLYSIVAKVIKSSTDDPLTGRMQNYVRQLLPSTKNEEIASSCSVLKENPNDDIQSLADGINLMEIPLFSLNLSEQELCDLIPMLSYIDLCNMDITKYHLKKFKLNFIIPISS